MVPEGTKIAASLPSRADTCSSRRFMVGSSPNTSSPTSARAIAFRISASGRVTVSLRRSMGVGIWDTWPSFRMVSRNGRARLNHQFSHLLRAHRLLSSHHRYAMEEVGTLRVQRDDLVPVQR